MYFPGQFFPPKTPMKSFATSAKQTQACFRTAGVPEYLVGPEGFEPPTKGL
jgi:hypothetical protein